MPNQHPKRPVETLKLLGSSEQYRRRGEVALIEGEPEPPEWLDESGQKQWARMVVRLRNQSILSENWRETLAAYCEAWSEYEALVLACRGQPLVCIGKSGAPYANPLFTAKARAMEQVLKLGKEFGLTPASKTGVRLEKGLPKNRKGYIKRA